MDQKVKIDIATTADTTGAAAAAQSLQKVEQATGGATKAAQDQGRESANTAKNLNDLGESAEKGAAAGRNLAAAIDGNVFALANLGPQLKAIGAVVRANPLGAIFVGLSAGLALLPTLIQRLGGVAKSTEDAGKAAGEAAPKVDALVEAIERANKAKSSALAAELTAIRAEAKGAADELERIFNIRAKLNAGAATDEQAAVQQRRRDEDLKLGQQFVAAQDNAARTREAADRISAERGTALANARAVEEQARAQRERRQSLEIELGNLQRQPGGTSPEAMARGDRMAEIAAELERMKASGAGTLTGDQQRYIAGQRSRAEALGPALEKAQQDAKEAADALSQLSRVVVGLVAAGPNKGAAIPAPEVAFARGQGDRALRKRLGLPEPTGAADTGTPMRNFEPTSVGLVVDGRSMAAAARAAGEKTGDQLVQAMADAIAENNAKLVSKMREELQAKLRNRDDR